MQIICWGCRGSMPCSLSPAAVTDKVTRAIQRVLALAPRGSQPLGPSEAASYVDTCIRTHGRALFSTYGGNTPCIECRGLPDTTLVFDLGSGFRELSKALLTTNQARRRHLVVFLTHLHLDHLIGLPMAMIAYQPDVTIHIYARRRPDGDVRRFLSDMHQPPFFPVPLDRMGARFEFHEFLCPDTVVWSASTVDGPVEVRACESPHPDGCVSYRVDWPGGSFVYATDREARRRSADFNRLCRRADLLIHDSQYLPEQYVGRDGPPRRGWGHSTYEMAVNVALDNQVGRLELYHHDPDHTDEQIDRLWSRARQYMTQRAAQRSVAPIPVGMAFDGMVWEP